MILFEHPAPLDSYTPSALTSGSPAGTYPLSGFENINLFNGNLTIDLKVGQVAGRGAAQWPINFHLETTHWSVDKYAQPYNCTPTEICYNYFYYPNQYVWTGTNGPADLYGRQNFDKYDPNCQGAGDTGLTRLTFRVPDGTEYELVDELTGGLPQTKFYAGCSSNTPQPPFNRGKIFVTTDGTAVTFVSDADITDRYSGPWVIHPSGYLMLRDGTRYRIDNGFISWIRDRNGNKLTFTRDSQYPGQIQKITDSLNREVVYGNGVTFKGFGGASRTVQFYKDNYLDENVMLRRDFRTSQGGTGFQTYQQLFPNLNGSYSGVYNFSEVTRIVLPDGRFYRLYYSPYGNIARIELPTGGAVEYDIYIFAGGNEIIDQRLFEKREYLTSDANAPVYKRTTFAPGQVKTYDGVGNLLSTVNHYFSGSTGMQFDPFAFNSWDTGKEYKTEFLAFDGVTVLRREENVWQQGCGPGGLNTTPRANNPRIIESKSTLVDTTQVSKQTFSYDCYNNKTDVYEYDYGSGAPPTDYLRWSHTDYLTTNSVNGQTYDSPYPIDPANPGTHLRSLPTQTRVSDASNVQKSLTTFEYDNYTPEGSNPRHAALVDRSNISGLEMIAPTRGNVTATTSYADAMGSTGAVTSFAQYDIAGNVVTTIDANNNATTIDYADHFGSPDGEAQSNTAPAMWLNGQTTFAFPTKATNALGHIAYTQFDYYLGQPVDTEDPNNVKSSVYYSDALDRPTKGINAVGVTGVQTQTNIYYDDNNRVITVAKDKDTFGESALATPTGLISKAYYDGLGRTYRSAVWEGGTAWTISETQFDALGRAYRATNPFRDPNSPTAGLPGNPQWTTSTFDALGRVTQILTSDGAHVDSQYTGNEVLVTDQASKQRKSRTNGIGQLVEVIEDPSGLNYSTTYEYDTLNNLAKVTQGTQQRYFMYDSLSRLIRAKNPEQAANTTIATTLLPPNNNAWSMAYTYDNNGSLLTKTDSNNLTTTNTYDALNRNTTIRYSSYVNGTSAVDLVYDYATNGKGRLFYTASYNSRWDSDGKPYWHADVIAAYDALGRPTSKWQGFMLSNAANQATTWQQYNMSASYNLAGMMTGETYPSGKAVNYAYDTAGRTTSFTGKLGGITGAGNTDLNYATGIAYNAAGMPTYEVFGTTTNLYHKQKFNSRHQLYDVRLSNTPGVDDTMTHGALQFFYDTDAFEGIHNNGNVVRADSWAMKTDGSGAWMAQYDRFAYDGLNRLWNLSESGNNSGNGADVFRFQQRFTFDRWGNRQIDVPNTTASIPGLTRETSVIDAATNRMTQRNGLTMSYDANGNQTNDGSDARVYTGENKLSKANGSGGVSYYYYDANGSRSRRVTGGQETWQIYGFGGELVAEYNLNTSFNGSNPPLATLPTKEYGYRNGQMLVVYDSTESDANQKLKWLVQDHLGSTRFEVGKDGSLASMKRHDYAPFGEELQGGQRATTGYGYTTAGVREKFTGYERDTETGLDYAQARYYASGQGRFTSVDPATRSMDETNPQSYNRYTYCLNNPLAYVDPDGLTPDLVVGSYSKLTDEQRRLFQTYVETIYSDQIGFDDSSTFSANLWNESAIVANGDRKALDPNSNLLNKSELTAFVGTTSMLEKAGVSKEVSNVLQINGQTDKSSTSFRVIAELKNTTTSVAAIEKAFSDTTPGAGHGHYSISRRERSPMNPPSGQVNRMPGTGFINVDVDYRTGPGHMTMGNSDIRANGSFPFSPSNYEAHVRQYGPVALTPKVTPKGR